MGLADVATALVAICRPVTLLVKHRSPVSPSTTHLTTVTLMAARRPRLIIDDLPPHLRKFALTAHVVSSVGWLGAVGIPMGTAFAVERLPSFALMFVVMVWRPTSARA